MHHLSPGFRKGRHTELHPAGYGLAVPRRSLAAAVFFPDTQPWEIRALPDVAEGLPELWRESDEVRMVALWVSEMGCIAAGGSGLVHLTQVRLPTISARSAWPGKLFPRSQVSVEAWIRLRDDRTGHRGAELRCRGIEKGRAQRDVLRPGEGTVHRAEILHDFANPDVLPEQLNGPLELELSHGKRQALKQLAGRFRDVVAIHRGFAVNSEARDSFFGRGPSKQVEAQIVAHDACQELGIGACSEVAVLVG